MGEVKGGLLEREVPKKKKKSVHVFALSEKKADSCVRSKILKFELNYKYLILNIYFYIKYLIY